jgi:hypothetical protein
VLLFSATPVPDCRRYIAGTRFLPDQSRCKALERNIVVECAIVSRRGRAGSTGLAAASWTLGARFTRFTRLTSAAAATAA